MIIIIISKLEAIMTEVAIILGPIFAVLITLFYQRHKEKRDFKFHVFYDIMSHRKSFPISQEFVKALNLIDVAFSDNQKILSLWHEYYQMLHQKPENLTNELLNQKFVELLSQIALDLGYKNIQQVDIDKFYTPVGHLNQFEYNVKLQTELLRVLENTSKFQTDLIEKKPETQSNKNEEKHTPSTS